MKFVANSNRQSTDASTNDRPGGSLHHAATSLAKSETGQEALGDLLAFLNRSGLRLDAQNRQHCCTLLAAAWNGQAGTVLAAMRARVAATNPDRCT